jgi:DNA-binding transcriptional MerR regulator
MKSDVAEKSYLRSGELAGLSGISTDTLRHYERLKLLPVPRRSAGNYRLYSPETVDRVRLIRAALAVGFSLRELSEIFKIRSGGGSPCRKVKILLDDKLARIDEQISDLLVMRDHIRSVSQDWARRLAEAANGEPARLLESLTSPARGAKSPQFKGKQA